MRVPELIIVDHFEKMTKVIFTVTKFTINC